MTKLSVPLLSMTAQGKLGDTVVYTGHGDTARARVHVDKADPRSWPQLYHRWLYADYCAWWATLTPAAKAPWLALARSQRTNKIVPWLRDRLNTMPDIAGLWHLDEIAGGQVLDSSRNANHGTVYGATLTPGRYDHALLFDNIDDRINCGNSPSLQLSGPLTLEFWANFTGLTGDWQQIAWKRYWDVDGSQGWQINLDPTLLQLSAFRWFNDAYSYSGPVTYTPGTWQHWAFTYDGAAMRLYRAGLLATTPVANTWAIKTAQPLLIGGWGYQNLNGLLDEIRHYNRALSPAEVMAHAHRTTP